MGRTALQANIDRLRAGGFLSTRGSGKALSYVVLPGIRAATCPESGQVMPGIRASDARNPGRDPNYSIQLRNPPAASPLHAGWAGVSADVVEAIRSRDTTADGVVDGQRRGVLLKLLEHRITEPAEVAAVWMHLVAGWAERGKRPWDGLQELLSACAGARDLRRVLLYRLREAA